MLPLWHLHSPQRISMYGHWPKRASRTVASSKSLNYKAYTNPAVGTTTLLRSYKKLG